MYIIHLRDSSLKLRFNELRFSLPPGPTGLSSRKRIDLPIIDALPADGALKCEYEFSVFRVIDSKQFMSDLEDNSHGLIPPVQTPGRLGACACWKGVRRKEKLSRPISAALPHARASYYVV